MSDSSTVLMFRLDGTRSSWGTPEEVMASESGIRFTRTSSSVFSNVSPSRPKHLVAWPWLSRSMSRTR